MLCFLSLHALLLLTHLRALSLAVTTVSELINSLINVWAYVPVCPAMPLDFSPICIPAMPLNSSLICIPAMPLKFHVSLPRLLSCCHSSVSLLCLLSFSLICVPAVLFAGQG